MQNTKLQNMKKTTNYLMTGAIIVSYFFIAIGSSENTSKDKEKKNEASFLDTIPQSQKSFFALEKKYDSLAPEATNDLKAGIIAENKAKDQRKLFSQEGFQNMTVKKWRGTVEKILSIDGDAGLVIKCYINNGDKSTTFYLTSEALLHEDNLMGKGPIQKSSPLYNKIANLTEYSEIEFSGNFYKSLYSNRYLYSCTESDFYELKYLFKISDIKVLKAH